MLYPSALITSPLPSLAGCQFAGLTEDLARALRIKTILKQVSDLQGLREKAERQAMKLVRRTR